MREFLKAEQQLLTPEERKALKALRRLASRWPETLTLFGWSGGDVYVLKGIPEHTDQSVIVSSVPIMADGGDPDMEDGPHTVSSCCDLIHGDWLVEKIERGLV